MADFSALKTAIQTYIKQNGNEEITGDILQEILLSVVTTLGDSAINDLVTALANEVAARQNADGTLQQNITNEATARGNADTALQSLIDGITDNIENGYVYAGIATPSSTPATGKVFYLALTAGTYTNFGSTEVTQGINILKYNGSAWSLDAFIGIDDTPTPNSPKLVKSGGVFDKVMTDGSAFDISAHFASGGTLATYADLSAALAALNTLSASYKKGGMSIKFVQTSDNKYVQYRLMSKEWSIDIAHWEKVVSELAVREIEKSLNEEEHYILFEPGNIGSDGVDLASNERQRSIGYLPINGSPTLSFSPIVDKSLRYYDSNYNYLGTSYTSGAAYVRIIIVSASWAGEISITINSTTLIYKTNRYLKNATEKSVAELNVKINAVESIARDVKNKYSSVSTRGYINFDNANGKLILSANLYYNKGGVLSSIPAGSYNMDLSDTSGSNFCVLVINNAGQFVFKSVNDTLDGDVVIAAVVKATSTSLETVAYCVVPYRINGIDIIAELQAGVKAIKGDVYPYQNSIITATGDVGVANGYMCTGYLLIDNSSEIKIKGSQAASMQLCVFYEKDGTFIKTYKEILAERGITINTGNEVEYTIPASDIPENAQYIRCSANIYSGGYIENKGLSLTNLCQVVVSQDKEITRLNNDLSLKDLDIKASTLETQWKSREQYLRDLFTNGNEPEHWYGVEWTEENNPDNVVVIYSNGDSVLHTSLPIQSKMRRCVVKDGIVQYYLDANNSELKEDGTAAKLDGTDGDVMVEIPECFYRFEENIANNVRTLRVKISEQGLPGFVYSPQRYTSAYEATVNRTTNKFASVCTTNFSRSSQEVVIKSQSDYTEGTGYSLGIKSVALRNGFTANAANFRGGVNNDNFDSANDPTISGNMSPEYHTFARNQLGIPVSNINRTDCRNYADVDNGKFIHQYDTVKILWIFSIIELKTRNIQNSALGLGAVKYPNYNAYESFFTPLRGISCIPCGVTNSLGNNSGEVYYKMQDVPVGSTGYGEEIVYTEWNNVWMPCMSYRGVENFYGHIYKIVDQLSIVCEFTGEYVDGHDGDLNWGIYNVAYYYTKNPYLCNDEVSQKKLIASGNFASGTRTISSILGTSQGHILPIKTDENNLGYNYNYCDCCEIYARAGVIYPTYNGRIVSGEMVGSNFIVGADSIQEGTRRPSDGTRIDCFL